LPDEAVKALHPEKQESISRDSDEAVSAVRAVTYATGEKIYGFVPLLDGITKKARKIATRKGRKSLFYRHYMNWSGRRESNPRMQIA